MVDRRVNSLVKMVLGLPMVWGIFALGIGGDESIAASTPTWQAVLLILVGFGLLVG
ncbi:hypothetical protein ACFR9U_11115 [Halorientalis brevis]|uniref:Uncharacterized protein n=1 Tax=Halorientalis brevis TaxID=1126241 RepID=A0ABD6CCX6_9EURY|nr:hypothetical protein [Halorientalis brevis]